MPTKTMSADICLKMVEATARSCQPSVIQQAAPTSPDWDAIAVSLTSQSNAIAFGAVVLAVMVAVAGIAWGVIITRNAEREARAMAKACAEDYIARWLADEAPGIIRERVDLIIDATLGPGDDAKAADDLGKSAG